MSGLLRMDASCQIAASSYASSPFFTHGTKLSLCHVMAVLSSGLPYTVKYKE